MEVGRGPGGQPVHQCGRAAGQPDQVGDRRVGPGAELVQVAAGAEVRPGTAQRDLQRGIGDGDGQGPGERVAHPPVDRVTPGRPVQRDPQLAPGLLDEHPVGAGLGRPDRAAGAPAAELRAFLHRRVGRGLGDQRRRHRQPGGAAQQQRQRGRGHRAAVQAGADLLDRGGDPVRHPDERRDGGGVLGQDHVGRREGSGGQAPRVAGDDQHHRRHPGDIQVRQRAPGRRVASLDDQQRGARGSRDALGRGRIRQQVAKVPGIEFEAHRLQHA